ncbi:alpha/beta hydrolase-fold protein [Mycobacterium malmoense]|uniref:alpha/beta hydrolase-fold protein n=1 Tax=Mycobacterium malmoense TaxID=1780 RepID=UPI000A79D192
MAGAFVDELKEGAPVSLLDVALSPLRTALRVAGGNTDEVRADAPESGLLVEKGMPEGVPRAALRPEPRLPAPAGWPFGEDFPRTCGTGRLAGGAFFWTDFVYDDHGAAGTRVKMPEGRVVPPKGTYIYPEGPAAGNGADIFRIAIGLTETDTWWRIDWNTLIDPSVPLGLFAFDTGREGAACTQWPAGAGLRSTGIDSALLLSGAGAKLMDLSTQTAIPVPHTVDMQSRSFLARIPRALVEPTGTWTVRMVAGLANGSGDGFADVPREHGAQSGQPNVYNVAFRRCDQEAAYHNFFSERAQAAALADGDISQFSVNVSWSDLAAGTTTDEPVVPGTSTRWYVSSIELGQGLAQTGLLATEPQFLGRVQPYSVCLPKSFAPGKSLPLTLLLHSIAMGQNQFAAVNHRLLDQMCDKRDAVIASPLGRGPACWYFDEGELDVWEVWARVAEQLGTDPNRTVIVGYSMGGYAAYRLGLTYPAVFSQAVVLAGSPTCGIRLLPGVAVPADVDPDSHCACEGETWPLLRNARWLPLVIAHGLLDEFVPFFAVAQQLLKLHRLGYRYHFTLYPVEDHVAMAVQGKFADSVAQMSTRPRKADPGRISFSWYPQLERADLGLGPQRNWWISGLAATPEIASRRGAVATVEARSLARPDVPHRVRRRGGLVLSFRPMPGTYAEQTWRRGRAPRARPHMTLELTGVARLTVDIARAGLATLPRSTITITTDGATEVTLEGVPPSMEVRCDGERAGRTITVSEGRHHVRLRG